MTFEFQHQKHLEFERDDARHDTFLHAVVCEQCSRSGPEWKTERGSVLLALDAEWLLLNARFDGSELDYSQAKAICPGCRPEFD